MQQTQVKVVPDFLYRGVPLELEDQKIYEALLRTQSADEFSALYPNFLAAFFKACREAERRCGKRPSKVTHRSGRVTAHLPNSSEVVEVPYEPRPRRGN